MNLGLTGPLNPLRPGNAAPGARLPRSPPALGREAAGSGVFVAAAGPAGRGGRGGRLASGAPGPPFVTPPPSALPPALPPRPGRPPLYFSPWAGRARPGSGYAVVPGRTWGPQPARRLPSRGAPVDPGPRPGPAPTRAGDRGAAWCCRSEWGSRPARGAREAGGALGSRSAAVAERTRAQVSRRLFFPVGKSPFLRARLRRAPRDLRPEGMEVALEPERPRPTPACTEGFYSFSHSRRSFLQSVRLNNFPLNTNYGL